MHQVRKECLCVGRCVRTGVCTYLGVYVLMCACTWCVYVLVWECRQLGWFPPKQWGHLTQCILSLFRAAFQPVGRRRHNLNVTAIIHVAKIEQEFRTENSQKNLQDVTKECLFYIR